MLYWKYAGYCDQRLFFAIVKRDHNLSVSRYRGLEMPYLAGDARVPTVLELDKVRQILSDKGLNVLV